MAIGQTNTVRVVGWVVGEQGFAILDHPTVDAMDLKGSRRHPMPAGVEEVAVFNARTADGEIFELGFADVADKPDPALGDFFSDVQTNHAQVFLRGAAQTGLQYLIDPRQTLLALCLLYTSPSPRD